MQFTFTSSGSDLLAATFHHSIFDIKQGVEHSVFDPSSKSADAIESLKQLVRVVVGVCSAEI